MNRAGFVIVSCLAAALSIAGPASADSAAQARFHDELAREHYAAGRFESALKEFFLEQRVAPNPRIAFNIALCFQQLKRPEDAFQFFNEYLSSEDDDPERRGYAHSTTKKLEADVARVLITTVPAGADVYVDQREHGSYGKTPRIVALSPGEHKVWTSLAGHTGAEASVVAKKGEQADLNLSLVRIVGELSVTSPVQGQAEVKTSDGAVVASGATPLLVKIPPGSYEVSVRAQGHLPWNGLASVQADKRAETSAAPQPAPAATGDITVTSNIAGAVIELDGQPAGFSPSVLSGVRIGRHSIKVRGSDVLPWSGPVEVGSDERAWVTVSLEEPPTVRRSSATWVAGGLGAAAFIAAGVFGALAASAHDEYESANPSSDRSDLRDRGVTLNTAADVLLVTGIVATGTAVALYFLSGETQGRDSSASIARSKR